MLFSNILSWLKLYVNYKNLLPIIAKSNTGGFKESILLILLAQILTIISISLGIGIGLLFSTITTSPIQIFLQIIPLSIVNILIFYLISALIFIVSKALGGQVKLADQTYLLSIFAVCGNILSIPFAILSQLPFIGLLMQAGLFILGIYAIYVYFQAIRTLNGFSILRAIAVIILSWVLLIFLAAILDSFVGIPHPPTTV